MKRLSLGLLMGVLGCATTAPAPDSTPAGGRGSAAALPKAQAAVQSAEPAADFRAHKPDPLPIEPSFIPPVPTERKLSNGAQVLIHQNRSLPLVAIQILIRAGVNADPPGKAGLADFTADMMNEGTRSRSALQVASELEDLAAEFSSGSGGATSWLHINCLTQTLEPCLDLLSDILQNPAFRPADLDRVRGLRLTALDRKRGVPQALAQDEVSRLLFGEQHPWGRPDGGTPKSIRSLTRADLIRYHQTWYRPNNATVVVSGDTAAEEILPLLERRLGRWKAKPVPALKLPPFPATSRSLTLIDKPGTSQSQVWVAGRLFAAAHPDAVPLRIANSILGGLFTSRLNLNLREEHGYSYSVHSHVTFERTVGQITARGSIISKNTAEAVAELEKELNRFSRGDIRTEELARAKESYIRQLPAVLETVDAVASALARLEALGLPLDHYRELPGQVARVDLDEVNRVARAYFTPAQWPIVVVGAKSEIEEPLRKLGFGSFRERTLDQVAPR